MITRFAPSPTGPLHLGHAYAALLAHDMAQGAGGRFVLRIEDIDQSRARPVWEAQIREDLHWLGLTWPEPVMRQSARMRAYEAALDRLWARGLLYPCHCNRRDIQAAISAPQEGAPLHGPDGLIYPGTCRSKTRSGSRPTGCALRLDVAMALRQVAPGRLHYHGSGEDAGQHEISAEHLIRYVGDVVLARRDMGTSYHLSVVIDDAEQAITHITRGADLAAATAIHVLLQALLGLPTPAYHHHRLIRDMTGKRLAKRDDARALAKYRSDGLDPCDIRRMVGL